VFNDPDFSSRTVRVTDNNTGVPCGLPVNETFFTDSSAEENMWNADTTKFLMDSQDGHLFAFTWNAVTMQSSFINVTGSCWVPLSVGANSPTFSYSNPNYLYGNSSANDNVIRRFDFSDNSVTAIKDLSTCGAGFSSGTTTGNLTVNNDDTRFSTYVGGQDIAQYLVVWDKNLGCRWYNTFTGQVGGDWGPAGSISSSLRFKVHISMMSRSGAYVRLESNDITGSEHAYWEVATLNLQECTTANSPYCGGHQAMGYTKVVNQANASDDMEMRSRPMNNVSAFSQLVDPLLTPAEFSQDGHWSWNNADTKDSVPFCGSTYQVSGSPTAITRALDREVMCIRTDGVESKVWRFAHHRATGALNQNAAARSNFRSIPIGNVSQDGKFYMFTSDWEWTLGTQAGSSGCPTSGTCRSDGFVVELK